MLERMGPITVTIEIVDVWLVDDRAYETGKWSYTFTPPEKEEERTVGGRYVTVWLRQPEGGWKIVADMSVPCGEAGN
jgi:ketosteroid isomerase-like protein